MIKAIIFDCYGVFYVDPIFAYLNDPASAPETAKAVHELDKQMVVGLLSQHDFIMQTAELLEISEGAVKKQFFVPSVRNQVLLDYAQELRKSYKVGMLSNVGSEVMNDFFSAQEREELFDGVVLSGDVGLAKPDTRIYQLLCDKLGALYDEAIMTDDLPSFCEGARNAGLQAIVFTSNEQFKQDLKTLLEK